MSTVYFKKLLRTCLVLGPFKLGMTNAEVAKITELRDCHPVSDKMECVGMLRTVLLNQDVKFGFQTGTKRLTEIELRLRDWASDDPRLADVYRELNFHSCNKEHQGAVPNWFLKEECYEAPDQLRYISWDSGHQSRFGTRVRAIEIIVAKRKGAYDRFVKTKHKERLDQAQKKTNRDFELGR